jgi:hypothetical protein
MTHIGDHMLNDAILRPFIEAHPYPLLFVTVSGAHLYGFASADSDYDLRGCHVAPAPDVLRLSPPRETYEVMDREGAVEMDLVTHDARKYFTLLLKNNGYVLEQVFSPLIVHGGPDFDELRELARGCITKNHHYHYDRFALGQWQQVTKRPTVKGLLYTYRVLLAGIHLMRTAEVQANLRALNDEARLGFIDELIERKTSGAEKAELRGADLAMHEREFNSLRAALESAREASGLPEKPTSREGLSDLLVRLRLAK